jgi:uridylate kinase
MSGEALVGGGDHGIEPATIKRYANDIKQITLLGVEVGVVIGGGNIFRGAGLVEAGIDRVTGDQMGMLATVMNALAMRATLESLGIKARVLTALDMGGAVERYSQPNALRYLNEGEVVLFAAGTGNPFFTTDTAAGLRAIEIGAGLMLKATKVDGVYSDDPVTNPSATRYDKLVYDQVLAENLKVMDATAIILCRDHGMPVCVFDINRAGALTGAVCGDDVGTMVTRGENSD